MTNEEASRQDIAMANTAHWRAMPTTRLLDGGMVYADTLLLGSATAAGEAWDTAAERLGSNQMERATIARSAGHAVTARNAFRAAAADFLFAQMAINADTTRKRELYELFSTAVEQASAMTPSTSKRVEIPFAHGKLVGWQMMPDQLPHRGTVVLFGGQSGWGAAYLRYADALAARGLATIMVEGPGQGETRMRYGIYLDVDVAAAYGEFVSYAATLGAPVGIMGNSVGGLFAALTAARSPEVKACCVNGAFAVPRLLSFRTFREQAAAMLGNDSKEAIEDNFHRLRFDPHEHQIRCPLLVLHGGADPLVSLADQQPFLDSASAGNATLQVWDDGEHTIYNHSEERNDFVADWFVDNLPPSSTNEQHVPTSGMSRKDEHAFRA